MSEVKVNKISPRSGTAITLGDSGDTFTIPSGATLAIAGSVTGFTSAGIDDNATSVAITIDSSENVGIGSTAPSTDAWSGANSLVIKDTSGDNGLTIISSSTTNNGNIAFADSSGGSFSDIGGLITYLHNGDSFRFMTANAERMRINSTGLGIGTSSPPFLLSLSGNSQGISFTDTSGGSNAKAWLMQGLDSDFRLRTQLDNYTGGQLALSIERSGAVVSNHQFYTEDSERMRLTTTGLGIGSSAPTQKLLSAVDSTLPIPTSASMGSSTSGVANGIGIHNTNNSAQYSGLTLETRTSNASRWLIANEWKSNFNGDLVFRSRIDGSSSSEILRLKSDGKVGIGTASPSEKLDVSGSINLTDSLKIDGSINFEATASSPSNESIYKPASYSIAVNTNGAEMARFSDSRLLINSTANVSSEYLLIKNNYTRSGMTIKSNTANAHHAIEFHNTNNQVGFINTSGTSTVYSTSSDYRLKENVSYDFDATSRLKELKPARFNFIADADKTVDGFIAHEVSSVVPEAISGEKDAVDDDGNPKYQGIDQSKLVPLLVKTIQELEARITTLEANNP